MVDTDLGLTLVFNGCIYNYRDLRTSWSRGLPVLLHRDTEVLAQGLPPLGAGCVEQFKGMFAFAISDRDTGEVVLAATASASSRSMSPETPGRSGSRRPCRRCSPAASWTPTIDRSRCTTT